MDRPGCEDRVARSSLFLACFHSAIALSVVIGHVSAMTLAHSNDTADQLLTLCRRYADAHADRHGMVATPVPDLTMVRALQPGDLQVAIQKPLIAILLQGRKRVSTLDESFEYSAGEAMVIAADVPTASQITEASIARPYYALVLEFDLLLVRELAEMVPNVGDGESAIRVVPVDERVIGAAHRTVELLDRPHALTALGGGLLRELHFWLLCGPHGAAIRRLGIADTHAARIGRAVDILRENFARTVRVQELADAAGMSEPSFHQHFRAITTVTPLQFQKQLRLIEARRRMLAGGAGITQAAHAVGYASVPQFTRDYARMFSLPPGRDMRRAKENA